MNRFQCWLVCAAFGAMAVGLALGDEISIRQRRQVLKVDATGHNRWEIIESQTTLAARQTAIIVCDMWDKHWCRGATERVDRMAPKMNQAIQAARACGVTILHAPSDTMDFYKDHPARKRVLAAPHVPMPAEAPHTDPPQPVDASDGGCDTGEKPWYKAWSRQHPAIQIDPDCDGISDNGQEVWNFFAERGIKNVILMGVHTNMCVLGRPFAIKTMVRRGKNVMLVRDLTDAMYNPERPPYLSHEEGTRLVIEYVEKFWCPTIRSEDLLRKKKAS